ncbi:transporter [Sphingomonas sp.]|uniref:transporter n=1 Tax=Sphingomonas sp. TaxID=28214 RepID=UPI0025DB5BC7|nr:transporter [Sphingomonas sp.]
MKARHFAPMLCVIGGIGATGTARAEDITFAVIGPHEYDLPTDGFRPFDVVVQYGEYNSGSKRYDGSGHRVAGPDTDLVVGLTKYVHFWTFDGLPDVGFAYEYIQPEVRVTGPGVKASGFGDPLTGIATWFKPSKNSTLGFQTFVSVPIGAQQVTNDFWANYSSFFFDVQSPIASIGGDIGAIFRGNRRNGSTPDIDEGNSYHANVRASLKTKTPVEPFVSFDWQKNQAGYYRGGLGIASPAGHDTALGAGAMVTLSKKTSLTLRYSRSIDGRNVTGTNAAYFKFALLF